jgi:hypothetical protein
MKTRRVACQKMATLSIVAALFTAAAAGQSPTSQQNPGSGAVFGRVLDHETGSPVRFAEVQVSRVRSFGGMRSTVASEDGTFVIAGLQPGSYVLAATSAAHAPSYYSNDAPPVPEPGTAFVVQRDQRTGPLEIRLIRGGVITGTVTDPNGDPVTSAMVNIQRWPALVNQGQSPFYVVPRFVYSDVNGVYRAFGLPAGEYLVGSETWYAPVPADPVTGRPRKYVRAYYPDTADPAAAVPVEVVSGQARTGIDLRLRVSMLFKVSGTVSVPEEAKVEFISVRFQYANRAVDADLPSTSGRRWTQGDIPPGNYVVLATATEPYIDGPPPAEGRLWWATVPVTVADQDTSGIALILQSSAVVSGHIVIDGPDAASAPDARPWTVTLSAIPGAPPIIRYPPIVAGRVGASGQFVIRNVTPGRYALRLVAAPTDTAVILSAAAGGRTLANGELEITAASTIENLVVRVRR